MKKVLTILALSVCTSNAFADMAIECRLPQTSGEVSLADGQHGYRLTDSGNELVGVRTGLAPSGQSTSTLKFVIDDGSSVHLIYKFSNLFDCQDNDSSENVKLTVSTQTPGQKSKVKIRVQNCSCRQD